MELAGLGRVDVTPVRRRDDGDGPMHEYRGSWVSRASR